MMIPFSISTKFPSINESLLFQWLFTLLIPLGPLHSWLFLKPLLAASAHCFRISSRTSFTVQEKYTLSNSFPNINSASYASSVSSPFCYQLVWSSSNIHLPPSSPSISSTLHQFPAFQQSTVETSVSSRSSLCVYLHISTSHGSSCSPTIICLILILVSFVLLIYLLLLSLTVRTENSAN